MFIRLSRFFIVLFIVLLLGSSAAAEVVTKIAAVVNDAIITTHQLEKSFQEALALQPKTTVFDSAEKEKMRLQVLDQLIEEELFKERVKQLRLKVTDEDVDAAIRDIQTQNKLTLDQLKLALKQQGMDFAIYRENLRKQILRYKLIGIEVQSKAEVTSAEVREYYREHLDDYRDPPFMHLSRLTFPIPKGADKEKIAEIREMTIEARKRLQSGDSINTLLVSYATANVDGGDMGNFRIGELTGDFDRVVRDLEAEKISEIVAMPNAFFIFKMIERSAGKEKPFDTVSAEIEQILIEKKSEEAFKAWNKSLRKDAYIDVRI